MQYNLILCGVGGQGVLSLAAIIATTAGKEGLRVRQSEVHGMAQRGGAVLSHMRISDQTIDSDLVPRGQADIILSMEPLEALRYVDYLSPEGLVCTASDPFINIPNYPEREILVKKLSALDKVIEVPAEKLAAEAGSKRASNMVMVGAVAERLPMKTESFLDTITHLFSKKGEKIVDTNHIAFRAGMDLASEASHG